MLASLVTFAVGLGIRFFLTPYIVRTLGAEAYGFIGLSANILSYTSLLTIALNSMAGRYITIKYCSGEIDEANKYYSSVFYSNVFFAFIILSASIICVIYIEKLLTIPPAFIYDVKALFAVLSLNTIVGLLSSVWGVATFIKNRLDLSNVRTIVGSILNAATIIILFAFFPPRLWFVGAAGMVLTIYQAITNHHYSKTLTPELIIERQNYQWGKIHELLKAGAWNLLTKLGEILGQGLDLLLANVFIGAASMGYFSLTKNVPFLILGLFQVLSGVFAPIFTQLYANKKNEELVEKVKQSILILSVFTAIPLVFLYLYGESFYALWLPTENAHKLQVLTIVGTFALPYCLPLESLWNIFTVVNKVKVPSIFMVCQNLSALVIVISCMYIVTDSDAKLLILAGTRSALGIIRGFIFLPLYGARCLSIKPNSFYITIFQSLLYFSISFLVCYLVKFVLIASSWSMFILAGLLVSTVCIGLSFFLILNEKDRMYIKEKVVSVIK